MQINKVFRLLNQYVYHLICIFLGIILGISLDILIHHFHMVNEKFYDITLFGIINLVVFAAIGVWLSYIFAERSSMHSIKQKLLIDTFEKINNEVENLIIIVENSDSIDFKTFSLKVRKLNNNIFILEKLSTSSYISSLKTIFETFRRESTDGSIELSNVNQKLEKKQISKVLHNMNFVIKKIWVDEIQKGM